MLERDDDQWVVMPGETIVTDPVTGEKCIKLTPEDEAALIADCEAADREGWIEITDPEAYVRELLERVEARRRGDGDGAVSSPDQ